MTFLDTIKNEIVQNPPKKTCCRRNMLLGLLAARGQQIENATHLRLSHSNTEELALRLIKEQFGREAKRISSHHGGRSYALVFESQSSQRFLAELGTSFFQNPLKKLCPQCSASFLKGVFLASGHITDPQKAYRLEFSLGERADAFLPFFTAEYGYLPKRAQRKAETVLYLKDSSVIEDVMTVLGINDAAFLFMNCKIEKQFRNEANRRTNCEAGNITRAVNAAAKILGVLRHMEESGALSSLPEELADVARLRLAYPEASLTQLAALTTPPLTKSGVNHRLQKIMELSEKRAEPKEK